MQLIINEYLKAFQFKFLMKEYIYGNVTFTLYIVKKKGSIPDCRSTESKKRKYKFKYIFYFLEWEANPESVVFTGILCAPAPRLAQQH